ncbi:MAG: hypothetical protein C4570_07850 [Ammonifex sp.]|jgi:hypothetical protein|nr:MAG: hypothetical protein C4570_07850 [Ammonifex sp.]
MKRSKKPAWLKNLPEEIWMRFDDRNEEPTLEEAIAECRYVIDMIQDGGCWYNEDEDEGEGLVRQCRRWLKRYAIKLITQVG